jgi:hypothetical protein
MLSRGKLFAVGADIDWRRVWALVRSTVAGAAAASCRGWLWRVSRPCFVEPREGHALGDIFVSEIEVEVTLQLTVSQSVCEGIEPTLWLVTRYYFLSKGCCLKVAVISLWRALSDERSGQSFVILSR